MIYVFIAVWSRCQHFIQSYLFIVIKSFRFTIIYLFLVVETFLLTDIYYNRPWKCHHLMHLINNKASVQSVCYHSEKSTKYSLDLKWCDLRPFKMFVAERRWIESLSSKFDGDMKGLLERKQRGIYITDNPYCPRD